HPADFWKALLPGDASYLSGFKPEAPEQRVADFVRGFAEQRSGVGPTRETIRDLVFGRGEHSATFDQYMDAARASLIEPYDDNGTERFKPTQPTEPDME